MYNLHEHVSMMVIATMDSHLTIPTKRHPHHAKVKNSLHGCKASDKLGNLFFRLLSASTVVTSPN